MKTGNEIYSELVDLEGKRMYMSTVHLGKIGVILRKFGADDIRIVVDDDKEWEAFENGDELEFGIDDIIGYELR